MDGNSGQNQVSGTNSSDDLSGTNRSDILNGMAGDDVLNGAAGADIYNGGAGNDRYVLGDTDAVETLHFNNTDAEQDILDVSNLLPDSGVNASNLKQFVKINTNGVFVDASGAGQFSSENQVARFAANNPPLNAMVAVQVADTSVIHFDWTQTANDPLLDAEVFTSLGNNNSQSKIMGTHQADNLQGTSGDDALYGKWGDDVLNGGAGADIYVGGAGSDRYVLADTDAVDTLDFQSTRHQKDVLDISQLLPMGVTSENLGNYLKITEEAVYFDSEGEGNFAEGDKIAEFTENSVFSRDQISVQLAPGTKILFDVASDAGVRFETGESFETIQSLTQNLHKYQLSDEVQGATEAHDASAETGFIRSGKGKKFNLDLQTFGLKEAHGGEGDEQLDASSVVSSGAQSEPDAGHEIKLYGRDGNDTLIGGEDGGFLDGGKGNDRIQSGRGRNLLSGGEGEDEFALSFEASTDSIKSDKLYDFSSQEGHRDLLDLQNVLPAQANAGNIHSYVKVTGAGVFVDLTGNAHFSEETQLARFGEKVDIDNLINLRLNDGSNIQIDRNDALSTIQGDSGSNKIKSGDGTDYLYGNAGDDTLDGDALASGSSADHLYGGEGNDRLFVDNLDITQGTVDGGTGYDEVKISASVGDSVTFDMHASGVEKAWGSAGDDVLDGSGFTDTDGGYNKNSGDYETSEAQRLDLYGRDGDDTLMGGVGRDYLDGGSGDDIISGGQGRDFLVGGGGDDVFILADDNELDALWDYKSDDSQHDIIDIDAFVADDFDYTQLANYFHIDSGYVYFDSTGGSNFTYSEAIAKMGGRINIEDPVNVRFNGIQVTLDTDTGDISVVSINAPTSSDQTVTGVEDSSYTFTASDFTFTDADPTDTLTQIKIDSLPASGTLTLNGLAITAGTVIALSDVNSGNFRFVPEADASGDDYGSFTFKVGDMAAIFSVDANTMTVNITPQNDAPILSNGIASQTVAEDTALSFRIPDNTFTDADGDVLTYSASMADGSALPDWLQFNSGALTFYGTPDNDDVGVLNLKVIATDPDGESAQALFNLEITNVNDAAITVADTDSGNASVGGNTITGAASVLANDSDVEGDSLSVTEVNGVAISGSTVISGDYGDLTIGSDGSWTYSPDTPDLTTGLVGHWTFNGNTVDSAAGDAVADNGLLHGTAAANGSGLNGDSLNLANNGDGFLLGASSEIGGLRQTDRTINFSFRIDESNDLSGRQVLFDEGGVTRGLNAYIDNGKLYIGGYDSSVGWDGTWYSIDVPADNDFHSLSLVLGNNEFAGYLDGEQLTDVVQDTSTGVKEIGGAHQGLMFGARYDDMVFHDSTHDTAGLPDTSETFIGEIDEARIYNRALNHQEIKALDDEFGTGLLQDVFSYTLSDGTDLSSSSLTIDVNRAPVALGGTLSGSNAGEIVGQLPGYDPDAGDRLTFSLESAPVKGSVTINADGSYTYNPGADFDSLSAVQTEDVTFDFRITDSQGESSVNTVTVSVTGTNFAPELTGQPMFDSIVAAYNFSDDPGSTAADTSGAGNTVNLSGSATFGTGHDGTGTAFEMNGSSGAGEISGLSTGGAMSISAWVRFDSFSQNWSRVVDFGNGSENNNILLAHAGTSNDLAFEIYGTGGPAQGVLRVSDFFTGGEWVHVTATVDESGAMRVYKNGELAGENLNGTVPQEMVRSNNYIGKSNWGSDGALDGAIDELVILNEALDASDARALYQADTVDNMVGDVLNISENSSNSSSVGTVSADDADNDSLTYTLTNDAGGRFTINSSTGEVTVADGSLLDYESATRHTISVQVSDGKLSDTRDYTVYITDENDAPVSADATLTAAEDAVITLSASDFAFTDADSGDALSAVIITTLPAAGTLTLNGVAVTADQSVSRADIEAGLLTFTPAEHEAGSNYASMGFRVHDGTEYSASEYNLRFDVTAVADAPVMNDISTGILNSNFDGGNTDGWQEYNPYGSGSSAFQNNQLYNWNGREVYRDIDTSDSSVQTYEITFDLSHNKNPYHTSNIWVKWGDQTVATYTESAGSGTVTSTKTILVTASGDPTTQLRFDQDTMYFKLDNIKVNKVVETDEDSALALPDLGIELVDTDGSETLAVSAGGVPAGAVLTDGVNSVTAAGSDVDISGWDYASLQITPPQDSTETIDLTFTATTTDTGGVTATTSGSLSIRVNEVSDKPVSEDNALVLKQSDSYSFRAGDFSFTDADAGDSMQSITITNLPAAGSLTLNDAAIATNQVISVADISSLKYTAPTTEPDIGSSFGFTVSDGSLSSDPQTFNLNVRGTHSDNLLTNASAENGTSGWNIIENGGTGWGVDTVSHDGDGKSWGTSYQWDKKSQTVDLLAKGFTAEALDVAPDISVSDWYQANHYDDSYYLKVELRDADNNVIQSFNTGTLTATGNWSEAAYVFTDYGPGVRYVHFEHGGKDSEYWNGRYGAQIDDSEVVVKLGDVELLGTGAGEILDGTDQADTIKGGGGSDTLLGGDGADLIFGGSGDDILSGGNDSDMFIWNAEDIGTAQNPAEDTITDFHAGSGGDVIDLSDVLVDDSEPLENYLSLNFENGDTTIEVKPSGSDVTQKIRLEGVDLSAYGGGSTDSEILNNLIDDGNLQID